MLVELLVTVVQVTCYSTCYLLKKPNAAYQFWFLIDGALSFKFTVYNMITSYKMYVLNTQHYLIISSSHSTSPLPCTNDTQGIENQPWCKMWIIYTSVMEYILSRIYKNTHKQRKAIIAIKAEYEIE